jgi:hypothetical protein
VDVAEHFVPFVVEATGKKKKTLCSGNNVMDSTSSIIHNSKDTRLVLDQMIALIGKRSFIDEFDRFFIKLNEIQLGAQHHEKIEIIKSAIKDIICKDDIQIPFDEIFRWFLNSSVLLQENAIKALVEVKITHSLSENTLVFIFPLLISGFYYIS